MTVSSVDIRNKLAQHIISRASHPQVPASLDGEILLEEHRGERGELLGVVSVSVDAFLSLPDPRIPEFAGKKLMNLTALDYANLTAFDAGKLGYVKYLDKWRAEGLL